MALTTNVRYVDVDAAAGGDGTTNALSGANCAYTSMSTWEAARQADLTTGDGGGNYVVEEAVCGSNHASTHTADTTTTTIAGWTTSANSYIYVHADATSAAGTAWGASKYRLEKTANYQIPLAVNQGYITIRSIQIRINGPTTAGDHCVQIGASTAGSGVLVDRCLVKSTTDRTNYFGLYIGGGTVTVRNTIVVKPAGVAVNITYASGSPTVTMQNCTVVGGTYGIDRISGTVAITNTYASAGTAAFNGTITQTTNASSDTTATGTSLDSIAYSTANFTNVTSGSEDLSLTAGSALIGVGTDLSGTFTTDILGTTRS